MTLLILIAQIATDPLSGGAGWVGTGLLGSVLGWLLFVHLPNKDKQILGLIESRDRLVEKLTADFRTSLDSFVDKESNKDKERREDFKQSLQKVVDHCEKEVNGTVESLKKEVDRISTYIGELTKKVHEERRGG
jgi:hypothetical protein